MTRSFVTPWINTDISAVLDMPMLSLWVKEKH